MTTTDNAKLLNIKNNLEEECTYFRKKKENILDYLIEKSKTTGKLPKELHIGRYELNTTFLNEFLEEIGYSVLYEEKHNAEVGFYYVVRLT